MCGILGALGLEITDHHVASLGHRGPDDQGLNAIQVKGKQVHLGQTRLSILDLSPAGSQPMQSKDKRWWITYNGELYNHLSLREKLDGPFRGHSDTETLIELIAAQGIDAVLPQLNGMFAFAALDTLNGQLFLARDPFGIKPLYYCQRQSTIAFASEVRALKAMGQVGNDVDVDAVQLFLTLRYVPSPNTLFKSVNRLPPGHVLRIDIASGETDLQYYGQSPTPQYKGSLQDSIQSYQQQMSNAVNRQLLSDVPVGVLLSGGVDSALVAAMAKDSGHDLPCYTVGFGGEHPECEIDDAAETAKILGLPFNKVEVTSEQLLQVLPDIVRSIEEPLGTTSVMPMWYLAKKAREDVTVVLTGQGTDEPWGGYRRYQVEMVRKMMPWAGIWEMVSSIGKHVRGLPDVLERGLRTLPISDLAGRAVEASALFASSDRELLVGRRDDGGAIRLVDDWLRRLGMEDRQPADRLMRLDSRMNLADDLLLYGDKISMATSLEARVPMLDIELVQYIESLPTNFRLALGKSKIVHKLMAEKYLPASIVHRKKRGFEVPFGEWSRGPWRDFIEDTLIAKDAPHFSILSANTVHKIWADHLAGRPDRSRQIFSLLMLAIWWREVLEP